MFANKKGMPMSMETVALRGPPMSCGSSSMHPFENSMRTRDSVIFDFQHVNYCKFVLVQTILISNGVSPAWIDVKKPNWWHHSICVPGWARHCGKSTAICLV